MKTLFPFLLYCLLVACTSSSNENNAQEEYYTVDDFDQVEKVDTHVHIRTERDAFFDQAKKDNFKLVNIVVIIRRGWRM